MNQNQILSICRLAFEEVVWLRKLIIKKDDKILVQNKLKPNASCTCKFV